MKVIIYFVLSIIFSQPAFAGKISTVKWYKSYNKTFKSWFCDKDEFKKCFSKRSQCYNFANTESKKCYKKIKPKKWIIEGTGGYKLGGQIGSCVSSRFTEYLKREKREKCLNL